MIEFKKSICVLMSWSLFTSTCLATNIPGANHDASEEKYFPLQELPSTSFPSYIPSYQAIGQ